METPVEHYDVRVCMQETDYEKNLLCMDGIDTAYAIGDIDGDGRPEIVNNTMAGAICAYNL